MSAARLHKRAVKKAAQKSAKVAAKKAAAPEQKSTRRKIGQYQHKGKNAKRVNNPAAGLAEKVFGSQDPDTLYQFDPHLHPQLFWLEKRERDQLDIPVRPLHIHERIDPRAIIRAVRKNGNGYTLPFELPEENLPLEDAVKFYQHPQNWANRLIAGDSLLVMNSLLEKESMAGKVQCVYMDPPYGIKYGSNFQPFVNKSDVKDRSDKDLTTEPTMIYAFRDTWKLEIHSYLSYLRDRLALCRELLADSGSCFVQISDENVHLVRNIMDEIFGAKNFIAQITVKKTSAPTDYFLPVVSDFVVWYAKDKESAKEKNHQLYLEKKPGEEGASQYQWVELPDGSEKKLNRSEFLDHSLLQERSRVFATSDMTSSHEYSRGKDTFVFQGREFSPGGRFWSTSPEGMRLLADRGRLKAVGNTLFYKRYWDDFRFYPLSSTWTDTSSSFGKRVYVVQTITKIVQRCILMTTDPGDLVLDPTCGSGTTAYVAEQWGRRWVTCDASRVALAIARQRLMTAHFPYYKLLDERAGVSGGFVCNKVPHVTLRSVANQESTKKEILYDQPDLDKKRTRITGPFTVEALPSQVVVSPDDIAVKMDSKMRPGMALASSRELSRHNVWRDELSNNGAQGADGRMVRFSRVETCGVGKFLHLEIETEGENPEHGFVSFGPEHAPMGSAHVAQALEEAEKRSPRAQLLVFAAFAFDPQAAKTLDEFNWRGGRIVKATMDPDLHVQDLKLHKRKEGDAAFWLMGRPDAEMRRAEGNLEEWVVEILGFDYYNPRKKAGERLESGGKDNIAMWMLDTDYDGRQLYPRQVFFPMGGKDEGWAKLARNLRAELDAERMEKYRGTVSLPFQLGEFRRAAVKIVDDRGVESLRILEAPE